MNEKLLTYEQARKKPNKRQDFLDEFFMANPSDAVEDLIYDPVKRISIEKVYELLERKLISEKSADETIKFLRNDTKQRAFLIFVADLFAKGFRFPIFVTQGLFKNSKFKDFESELEHEYFHAQDFKNGFDLGKGLVLNANNIAKINGNILEAVLDTRAYMAQIFISMMNNDAHIKAIKNAIHDLIKFIAILETNLPSNEFESKIIEVQLRNCQDFMKRNIRVKR